MAEIPILTIDDQLVAARFDRLEVDEIPTIHSDGRSNEARVRAELHNEAVARYRAELAQLAPEEKVRRLAAVKTEKAQAAKAKEDAEEQRRFFNKESAGADYVYWARMPLWTLDEGLALLLGKDPGKVSWGTVAPYLNISAFAKRYRDLRELVVRENLAGNLSDPSAPASFLAWAQHGNPKPDAALVDAVKATGSQIVDWRVLYESVRDRLASKDAQFDQVTLRVQDLIAEVEQIRSDREADQRLIAELQERQFPNPDDPRYASELDIAIQAWRAITNSSEQSGTPKQRAEKWLRENYPGLGATAVERISTVANFAKESGRPGK